MRPYLRRAGSTHQHRATRLDRRGDPRCPQPCCSPQLKSSTAYSARRTPSRVAAGTPCVAAGRCTSRSSAAGPSRSREPHRRRRAPGQPGREPPVDGVHHDGGHASRHRRDAAPAGARARAEAPRGPAGAASCCRHDGRSTPHPRERRGRRARHHSWVCRRVVRAALRRRRGRQDAAARRARRPGHQVRVAQPGRALPRLRRQRAALPAVLRDLRPAGGRRSSGRGRADRGPPRAVTPAARPPHAVRRTRRHRPRRHVGPRRPVRGAAHRAAGARRATAAAARGRGRPLGRPVHAGPALVPVRPLVRRPGHDRGVVPLRRPAPPPPAARGRRAVGPGPRCPPRAARPAARPRRTPPGGRAHVVTAAGAAHGHRGADDRHPRRGQRVLRRGAGGCGRGVRQLRPAGEPRRPAAGPARPARRPSARGGPGGCLPPAGECRTRCWPAWSPSTTTGSTGRCATRSSRTSWLGSATTPTPSGTRCSPRRSTTTCCPASASGCTRRTPPPFSSSASRALRRSWPGTRAPPTTGPPPSRASIQAGDEAMSVGGPEEAAQHYETALDLLRRRETRWRRRPGGPGHARFGRADGLWCAGARAPAGRAPAGARRRRRAARPGPAAGGAGDRVAQPRRWHRPAVADHRGARPGAGRADRAARPAARPQRPRPPRPRPGRSRDDAGDGGARHRTEARPVLAGRTQHRHAREDRGAVRRHRDGRADAGGRHLAGPARRRRARRRCAVATCWPASTTSAATWCWRSRASTTASRWPRRPGDPGRSTASRRGCWSRWSPSSAGTGRWWLP